MTNRLAFCVFILLLALSPTLAWCQAVSNVRASQTEDDQIIVTYDLLGESYQTFEISVLLSRDGGQNFDITPRMVNGDVGENVKPGRGKKMVWDVLMDVPRLQGSAFVFRVTAMSKQRARDATVAVLNVNSRVSTPDDETPPPDYVPYEKAPQILKRAQPIYPEEARKANLEGTVWIKIWVDKAGKPRKVVIQKSASDIFDQAAVAAAEQFVFTPALMRNGEPVDVWVSIPFSFRLK